MSLEGTDRYLSPYEATKRDKEYVNIFLPRDTREEPKPSSGHCPIHIARYIDYGSGSNDLRCPLCGYKKPVEVAVEQKPKEQEQQKIKKKNPVKGKKTVAMSQETRDKNKRTKAPEQIEIEKELGGCSQVSSYEEYDV